jgi:gamma-glutamylaminecyclotransferase
MRGGMRHRVLAAERFLGEARTRPHYDLYDLGAYPGLVHSELDGRSIHGELFESDDGLIAQLDRIEGAPSLFRLKPILIEDHPGEVFAYLYQGGIDGCSRCSEDRWKIKGSTL